MPIIVSKKGVAPAVLVRKSCFGKEENLQEYIHQYPEAIPIYDIQKDKRLFVAAREFATDSGPIDALGVDKDGEIYVIETKLYANADKRRVVAQALDYGASLWRHFSDFAEFIRRLDTQAYSQWNKGFQEKAIECFSLDDAGAEVLLDRMEDNLRAGNLKFVVLMDSMDERLKELIAYVNLKSQFDIYGVELELYEYEDYRIVLPRLYGAEANQTTKPPKPAITEHELLKSIAANDPTHAQWAEMLFARLRAMGLTSTASGGSTLSYGIDLNGEFVSLLDFQAGGVYAGLRKKVVQALGSRRFLEYKRIMNTLGRFYDASSVGDPSKYNSRAPSYGQLSRDIEEFIAKIKSVVEIVSSAFAEKVAFVGSVQEEGEESAANADAVEAELTIPATVVAVKNSSVLPEIVLEIGAEGGSLTILRERIAEGGWQFRVKLNETTLYDMLSEEDRRGMRVEDFARTEYAHTFQEALSRVDRYQWFRLCPLQVHPEFLDAVLAEVEKRGGPDEVARWREQLKSMAMHRQGFDRS